MGNRAQEAIFLKEGKKILNSGVAPGLFSQPVSAYSCTNACDSEGEQGFGEEGR